MLYVITVVVAVGLANGLQSLALNSLYAVYTRDAAYISVASVENNRLEHIVETALASSEVKVKLENIQEGAGTKFINYILPSEWHVSEIPMNPVEGNDGHHFPADYDKNLYRIVFTRAELRTDQEVEGKEIILNTVKRVPVGEVVVDLSQNQIVEIKDPPETIKYEGIPVPLY